MKKLKRHFERWMLWRKHSHMSKWYKFLVLVGVKYSPTFTIQLTTKERKDIRESIKRAIASNKLIIHNKIRSPALHGTKITKVWYDEQYTTNTQKLPLPLEFDGDPDFNKTMIDAGYDYFKYCSGLDFDAWPKLNPEKYYSEVEK